MATQAGKAAPVTRKHFVLLIAAGVGLLSAAVTYRYVDAAPCTCSRWRAGSVLDVALIGLLVVNLVVVLRRRR